MTSFTVMSNVLRGLLRVAPKQDIRYYLNGVHFDPASGRIVVTDGHMLVVTRLDIIEGVKPFTAPRRLIDLALKSGDGIKATSLTIAVDDATPHRRITITNGERSVVQAEIDGKYPEYMRVIPKSFSGVAGNFNPELLSKVQGALADISGARRVRYFDMLQNGPDGPAVAVGVADDTFAVIMPMRANRKTEALTSVLGKFGWKPEPAEVTAAVEAA